MASASAKKLAASNVSILNQLSIIASIINFFAALVIFKFHRPSSFKPWLFWSLPSFFLHNSLESNGRPKYDKDNNGEKHLVKSGEDIRLKGSLYEYYFDVIYITWFLDILMIIFGTNKVWYLYLVIPGFAIYKLSGFILPFIKKNKNPTAQEAEQDQRGASGNTATSKRQQKLQARREKGPAVRYR